MEVYSGVSDIEIWPLLQERENADLYLCWELHAKYYRLGDQVLVGSANLTGKGLGLGPNSNLELLVQPGSGFLFTEFEEYLGRCSKLATIADYRETQAAVEALQEELPEPELPPAGILNELEGDWIPSTRNPAFLLSLYLGEEWERGETMKVAALSDLEVLAVPQGLSPEAFRQVAGCSVRNQVYFRNVFEFCSTQRRFGEVRDWLLQSGFCNGSKQQASQLWQATIRWIAYFLPDSHEYSTPGEYSEIVRLR